MRALTPELCAINTATLGFQEPIESVIDAVARAGFAAIGPWRREVEGRDVKAIARRIRDAGLKVTGYCRSTFLPANERAEFLKNVEINRRAIDDAALLGAESFVIVAGGLPEGSKDLPAARAQITEGLALLAEHGRKAGVEIALEPLHPVYAADRCCINTLAQALDIPDIPVLVDVYHLWWDPNLARDIARASERIIGFHICDWLVPTNDLLNDRGMMGDGIIDVRAIRGGVEAAGYRGFVEIEIFSAKNWWLRPMAETLRTCKERLAPL